jgi:hypothetical protein
VDFHSFNPFAIHLYSDEAQTSFRKNYDNPTDGFSNLGVQNAWPFRSDSQVLHVLDCTTKYNQVSQCSRPNSLSSNVLYSSPLPQSFQEFNGKYRLFLYETTIIQKITFQIQAVAEGGQTFNSGDLSLNIICPDTSFITAPNLAHHNRRVEPLVIFHVGAMYKYQMYTFPGYYPSFEQCNFVTKYRIMPKVDPVLVPTQNTHDGRSLFWSAKEPHGLNHTDQWQGTC